MALGLDRGVCGRTPFLSACHAGSSAWCEWGIPEGFEERDVLVLRFKGHNANGLAEMCKVNWLSPLGSCFFSFYQPYRTAERAAQGKPEHWAPDAGAHTCHVYLMHFFLLSHSQICFRHCDPSPSNTETYKL